MYDFLLNINFPGLASSLLNEYIIACLPKINRGLSNIMGIAQGFIPIFFLIRIAYNYIQLHLDSAQLMKSIYLSFLALLMTYILLHGNNYMNLIETTDHAFAGCITKIDMQTTVKEKMQVLFDGEKAPEKENTIEYLIRSLKDMLNLFFVGAIQCSSAMAGKVMHCLRTAKMMFYVFVGPIAIVIGLLPGAFGKQPVIWFKALLFVMMEGITLELIDFLTTMGAGSGVMGIAWSISCSGLYLGTSALTSILINSTAGMAMGAISMGQQGGISSRINGMAGKVPIVGRFLKAGNSAIPK